MTTGILYLAHNRKSFTEDSLTALKRNTNWDRVTRIDLYDDGSGDGAECVAAAFANEVGVPAEVHRGRYGSPVAVMNAYLAGCKCDLFVKVDNDVMLPPRWLDVALDVMQRNPNLALLGLEPQRVPQTDPRGYVDTRAIGGVGIMRRDVFSDPMEPVAVHGGFDKWQLEHPQVKKGWLSPSIKMFLLDRLPMNPWRSISDEYIDKGWQRPWKRYTEADAALWTWWIDETVWDES
jgi:hypothetical protein